MDGVDAPLVGAQGLLEPPEAPAYNNADDLGLVANLAFICCAVIDEEMV